MHKHIAQLKILLGVILVVLTIGYVYFQARNMIGGPLLTINSPIDGSSVKHPLITISGIAQNITTLTINNREVSIDEHGNFREKLLVSPGYTIIEVRATDRFGRSVTEQRELVYLAPEQPTDTLPRATTSPAEIETPVELESEDDASASTTPIDLENS